MESQNNSNNQIPVPPGVGMSSRNNGGGGFGPIVATFIIVALLVLGGLYLWGKVLVEKGDVDVKDVYKAEVQQ